MHPEPAKAEANVQADAAEQAVEEAAPRCVRSVSRVFAPLLLRRHPVRSFGLGDPGGQLVPVLDLRKRGAHGLPRRRARSQRFLVEVIQLARDFLDDAFGPLVVERRQFRWTRTRLFQSGMAVSLDDAADGGRERFPLLALLHERRLPGFGQVVVAAAAFARAFDPAPGDEAAVLETVEDGVKGGDAEREMAARAEFDQAADLVPVSRAWASTLRTSSSRLPFLSSGVGGLAESFRMTYYTSQNVLLRHANVLRGKM